MTLNILIAGEGPNELGGWFKEVQYREESPHEGAIEALLRKAQATGWQIVDGIPWRRIRKLKARTRKVAGVQETMSTRRADVHNVAAVSLRARELHCSVLAFTRDRDGRAETQEAIEYGIAKEEVKERADLQIIGGVAIEKLESWIIALSGKHRSEDLGKARIEETLSELGIPSKDTERIVEIISNADIEKIPEDAWSLKTWIEKARTILSAE